YELPLLIRGIFVYFFYPIISRENIINLLIFKQGVIYRKLDKFYSDVFIDSHRTRPKLFAVIKNSIHVGIKSGIFTTLRIANAHLIYAILATLGLIFILISSHTVF